MQDKITKVFIQYIRDNNLTQDNYTIRLHEISYIAFFNDITINILGNPIYSFDKCATTTSSLTYIAESAKETVITNLDIIEITEMYHGVISRLDYNYKNYPELLQNLFELRKKMKKKVFEEEIGYDVNLIQMLIKVYLNLVYGMIDNKRSVLTSNLDTPREFIIESSKKAMLNITAFLINKGIPVYHINTDEIHCGSISLEDYEDLQNHYSTITEEFINTTTAKLNKNLNGFVNGYYKAKNQFILGEKIRMQGLTEVNDDNVRYDNKKYFGSTFPHQFPEYAI
jgi:hypothetical protein